MCEQRLLRHGSVLWGMSPSSIWFVRLYYTQIQLVIRLLLDHSKKPPPNPCDSPFKTPTGVKTNLSSDRGSPYWWSELSNHRSNLDQLGPHPSGKPAFLLYMFAKQPENKCQNLVRDSQIRSYINLYYTGKCIKKIVLLLGKQHT